MDSDPVDPRSSPSKRSKRIAVADSDDEVEERPRRSRQSVNGNGHANGHTKRRRTLPSSSESEQSAEEDTRSSRAREGKGRAENGGGHEEPGSEIEDDEDHDGEVPDSQVVDDGRPIQPQYRPEYERHPDGYVTGSITKIKLIDFMTYDFVEFNPGPHLNMILGPNGTGKSTVAAGIAIGLGFKPEIMGRATDLKSYVKQGKEEAWTEIEVRSKPGKRNHVIWRRFTKEEKSEWKLNGQPCTKKAILEVVGGYGIQANNLCCFLAQDRVAEFAKMSPPLTLKETMRAAGDPRLTEWHQKLVIKGDEKKKLEEKLVTDISRRDQVQAQMDKLAPDVVQFENRQEMEKETEILELLVEAAKGKEMERAHTAKSNEHQTVTAQRKALEKRNKPLTDLGREYSAKLHKASQKSDRNNQDLRSSIKDIKSDHSTLQNKIDRCDGSNERMIALKRQIKRRAATKQSYELRKAQNEKILAEAPRDLSEEANERSRKKAEVKSKIDKATADRYSLKEEDRKLTEKLANIAKGIDAKLKTRQQLENVETVRENLAIQANASIGYALEWIKEHEAEFEFPVGKPPMISVNVPQKQYAWQVEQSLTFGQKCTFVTQSRHDYELLLSLNNRRMPSKKLSNGFVVREYTVRLHVVRLQVHEGNQNPQRLCTERDLQALGLDGLAIDFVEADPVIIAFLNENCSLNRAAVTQRSGETLNSEEIAKVGFWGWLSKQESIRATRSRYGSRAFQISSQPGQSARFFNQIVDQAAVDKVAEEIANLKREKVDCEGPHTQLREDITKVATKLEQLTAEEKRLDGEIKAIRDRSKALAKAQTDIVTCNQELEKIAKEPTEAVERDKLIAEKMANAAACIPGVAALTAAHANVLEQADDLISSGLRVAQVNVNTSLIARKQQEVEKYVDRLRKQAVELRKEADRLEFKLRNFSEAFGQEIAKRSPAVQNDFNTRCLGYGDDIPRAEIEETLAHSKADLALTEGISANVVERHRRYKKDLEGVIKEVKEQEDDLRKVTHSVTTILSKFEPALDSLVSTVSRRFATAFDRNGCAGDVRLDKDDRGYEYWGLIPHVSFRDSELMQALTGQRQSGGERSYSTIMYLMALSEMARVPFSLVDEINQGMDQQAERTVFNQLVETTCDENAGQYFLITPKLLTDLTYHKRMKVLIVNNGCWLPEGTDKTQKFGDLKGCLKRVRASNALPEGRVNKVTA